MNYQDEDKFPKLFIGAYPVEPWVCAVCATLQPASQGPPLVLYRDHGKEEACICIDCVAKAFGVVRWEATEP